MALEVAIIVTYAPPLITLAAAQSLDYLLYPALPVIIPDAVFHEATHAAGKLGAQAQRIQSADAVMEAVRQAGRNPPRRDLWSNHDPAVRDAVRAVIERAHRGGTPE
jgi:hypothetical protein